jgi:hypothetical protein
MKNKMSPIRDIRPTMAIPAPMPALAPAESPEEDPEIGIDVLEPELELKLDEDVVDVVDTKSEAWYRIEIP